MVNTPPAFVLAAFSTGSVPAGSHQHSVQAGPSPASRKG
jgi:hypothetical protein